MRHFCTLFDINYLANFLALYESLTSNSRELKVYAFCMDYQSVNYLSNYEGVKEGNIICISLAQLIAHFPELNRIKQERSLVEFYFTCSSFICSYVFEKFDCEHITYLDADLLFFDSPEKIFQEFGDASIGIIRHRFYGWGKRFEKYGKYNVGLVIFKNDDNGRNCLKSWKEDCAEWCFDFYDKKNKRFGDQKYLDKWENNFKGVKLIEQKGANVAPWNIGQYYINIRDGKIFVDNSPLIFYHFASFKKVNYNTYTTNLSLYFAKPSKILKQSVYRFYLDKVEVNIIKIGKFNNSENEAMKKNRVFVNQTSLKKLFAKKVAELSRWYFNDYIYK
jgi:hypothetical protein